MNILLTDLEGARIDNIGTGENTIWCYLSSGVVMGVDAARLQVVNGSEWDDVWVDYADFLEIAEPRPVSNWRERSGNLLLLADLVGLTIECLWLGRESRRTLYLALDSGLTLRVPYDALELEGPLHRRPAHFDTVFQTYAIAS